MQLLIDVADNRFGRAVCGKDEARILLVSSIFKKSTKVKFLTFGTKKAFNLLRYAFIQVPIFQHFDLKWHIWIENNASSYAISRILSQLTLNKLD